MEWTRGHGAFRGLAHPTLARCSQMSAQAGHVDYAGGEKGDDKHLVHRGLQESLEESHAKHEPVPIGSPKDCFFRDSYLVYG